MKVTAKRPIPTPKPKMNTHPTHTCVWVGWGLQPLIVPIGVDGFFWLALFPPHLGESMFFFGVLLCFSCVFWSVGVCVEGVFLS